MDAQTASLIDALNRKVDRLTSQLRGSPGTSTNNGAINVRTTQLGFVAELTSKYNATTGYSFKRLQLNATSTGFIDTDPLQTGDKALAISGEKTLVAGIRGWMEPDANATGYDFLTLSSGSGGPDCSTVIGLIGPGNCFTLTFNAGDGSCGCVPAGQTATMTWDADEMAMVSVDYIYGCPPGVVTADCPGIGAPLKYVSTITGFTGTDCTAINTGWTLSYGGGESWSQAKATVSVALAHTSGTTWTITFTKVSDSSTLAVYTCTTFNCCAVNVFSKTSADGCDGGPDTITLTPATACGSGPAWSPIVDVCNDACGRPSPRLRLVSGSGSGAKTITFSNAGCSGSQVEFTTNDPLFCTGKPDGDCAPNSITVTLKCGSCTICSCTLNPISWSGPGWYCVSDFGCELLTSDPGSTLTLCYGPFETQDACENFIIVPCTTCDIEPLIPRELCVSFSLTMGTDLYGLDGKSRTVGIATDGLFAGTWFYQGSLATDRANEYGCGLPEAGYLYLTSFYIGASSDCIISISAANFTCDNPSACPFNTCAETIDGLGASGDEFLIPMGYTSAACALAHGIPIQLPQYGDAFNQYTVTISADTSNCANPNFNCTNSGCVDPGDGTGTYQTLAACEAACQSNPSWNCTMGACVDPGDGTGTYASLTDCELACGVLPTYNCVSGNCVDPGDGTGTYPNLQACLDVCQSSGQWWCINVTDNSCPGGGNLNCFTGGTGIGSACVQANQAALPGFPCGPAGTSGCTYSCGGGCTTTYDVTAGPFTNQTDCQTSCGVVASYNCVSGSCVDPGDGSGTYSTLAACAAACGGVNCCPNIHTGDTATMLITDGPDAGTYVAGWVVAGTHTFANFTTATGSASVYCFSEVGSTWNIAYTHVEAATAQACGPPPILNFNPSAGPIGTTFISVS